MSRSNNIPLFPLPNLVMFPDNEVPLHIFEPRYREMIADIAERDRIIGMVLLRGDWERDYYTNPDIYQVGCAGRIERLLRLPDGRYNLLLQATSEFRVIAENRERSYRQGEVQWCPVPPEALELDAKAMAELRTLLVDYIGMPAATAWKTLVEERGLSGARLINFLCFHLDLNPLEKQTLLEALQQRANCLVDILTFRLAERKGGPAGGSGGPSPLQ